MMGVIVSDSSPLISFARAGELDLLREVVGEVVIPEAVYSEIAIQGAGKPGATEFKSADWLIQRHVNDKAKSAGLPANLGQGEKEAIALCEELDAYLLADDPAARREAKARKIPLVSTLDVLDEAKDQGLIAEVKTTLDKLIRHGYRLKLDLYQAKLQEAGEQF